MIFFDQTLDREQTCCGEKKTKNDEVTRPLGSPQPAASSRPQLPGQSCKNGPFSPPFGANPVEFVEFMILQYPSIS